MKKMIFIALICAFGASAQADFDFDGFIANHNSIVTFNFGLATDSTSVEIWTDSFDSGANFDPITALWNASTGALIAQNDDNSSIRPATQTFWDSGIALPFLAAGNYFFTVASYANFANGSNISDGFRFDGQAPVAITSYAMANGTYPRSGYYHVNFAGVDSASPIVPVPGAFLLGSLGLGFATWRLKRRKMA